jgi:hypothetical protein
LLAAPTTASAQRYDDYPVCLQVFGPATYKECRYVSLAQCAPMASGRAAQCIVNPFYQVAEPRPRKRRR